jgi:pimeloyl-ACP methyl ester carboxylesterase
MGTAGFIPVTDGQLYYERDGQGQPLVLLHSGGLHCGEWDDQFAVFSRHYLVVRYDRRGYGGSPMPRQAFSHVNDPPPDDGHDAHPGDSRGARCLR